MNKNIVALFLCATIIGCTQMADATIHNPVDLVHKIKNVTEAQAQDQKYGMELMQAIQEQISQFMVMT